MSRTYKNVETIALPDRIFAFSDQETMLVLASDQNKATKTNVFVRTFWIHENDKRNRLLETGQLPEGISTVINRSTHREFYFFKETYHLMRFGTILKTMPRLGSYC